MDDLTVGDAINLFSLHEAPYRPFLTYRARIAIDGPLVHAPAALVSLWNVRNKIHVLRNRGLDPMVVRFEENQETVEKATIGGEKTQFSS